MSKYDTPPYASPQPGFVDPNAHHAPPVQFAPPPPTTQTVVVTQVQPAILGDGPTSTTCPYCHASIVTAVEIEANTKTHLIALLLCLCGCWPCVCVPYCMDSCQSKRHFCPNCKAYLGTFSD